MAELNHIYLRMSGYIGTMVMHIVNIGLMEDKLKSEEMNGLFDDPTLRFFKDNQHRYFTVWTFFLQIVYAAAGLVCDVLTWKNRCDQNYKLPKHLRGFRDTLFSAIQWPATFLVSIIFWSLFTYDRELILPQVLDRALTRESNHVMHTMIVPVVLWEIAFRPRSEPRSHWRNLMHLTLHYVSYFAVLFFTYFEKGAWIYPVFEVTAGTIYFPLFMLLIYLLLLFIYFIQWPITRLFHGSLDKCKTR